MKKSDEIKEKIRKKEEQIEKRKQTTQKFENKKVKMGEKLEQQGVDLSKIDDYDYRRSFGDTLYWDISDYSYMDDDIKSSNDKLKELEGQLKRLNEQLDKQLNKENVILIPAIEELLDRWEVSAREHIEFCHRKVHEMRQNCDEQRKVMDEVLGDYSRAYSSFHYMMKYTRKREEEIKETFCDMNGKYRCSEDAYSKMKEMFVLEEQYHDFKIKNQVFLELYGDEEKTQRFMRDQKEIRRIDLINRVTKVVGEITDASGLYFGKDDNINGIVTGTKGKARVNTIGAGGYAVQVYHYRVLVHPIKERESLGNKISDAKKRTGDSGKTQKEEYQR